MSHFNAEAIEDAVRAWIHEATQLPLERIIWGGQTIGPRPAGAPIALSVTLSPMPNPGSDWLAAERRVIEYAPRPWTIVDDMIVVTAHGLATGDGPFVLAGAVSGERWVIAEDEDHLRLADSFQLARTLMGATLPGSGAGSIAGGPRTVRAAEPGQEVVAGPRLQELEVQARGGDPTGSGTPWHLLDELATSVKFSYVGELLRAADAAINTVGDVQAVRPTVINKVYQEPYARWTCVISHGARLTRRAAVIEQVDLNPIVML